ncbi:MAG: hypothetical protein LBE25_14950 [Arthrobacter sp.]|jgi:hypothetical protein|nr:hypothetical protein [Arthrobacter sp.]
MKGSRWTLWAARLLLAAAAPWWFSLGERPPGLSGAVCALIALVATAYGGAWWALSLGTAACLLIARGTGRAATRASALAGRGLRILGLSALLGLLAAPLASASQGSPAPSLASSQRAPSPLWPTEQAAPPATPSAAASPAPDGAWPTGQGVPATPSATPAPDVTAPALVDPPAASPTPSASPSLPRTAPAPTREPAPDPTPSSVSAPRTTGPEPSVGADATADRPAAGSDSTSQQPAAGGFLPRREPAPLGRAWGGSGASEVVVVAPGDSLWSLARDRLGPGADAEDIAAEWPRWYRLNADVIGADPDLIAVGTRLFIPR